MSRDPWEGTGWRPGTLNYYAYVHGNPVNWVDHTGNDIEKPNDVEVDSPYTWKLPTTNTVQELAEVFMIPSELLGAILQIVQEVDYSTTGTLDNDWLEDCVFGTLSFSAHPAYLHPPLNYPSKVILNGALAVTDLIGKHPSPGLTQIQVRRAEQMERWLFEQRSGQLRYESMRQVLGRSENRTDLLTRLYMPETAVKYAAAHIRWLVEEEFGEAVAAQDMNLDKMVIIAAQYNIGPRSEIPVDDYSDFVFYRFARIYIQAWQIRLRPFP